MSELDPADAADAIYDDPVPGIESAKLNVSFWEKLVVLDAATLTLSFTATGFFQGHLVGDGGRGYLNAAWKLLFWAISFALFAQQIALAGLRESTGHRYAMRVLRFLLKAKQQRGAFTEGQKKLVAEILNKAPQQGTRGFVLEKVGGCLGTAALGSTVAAFYWLYRFAHANVITIGRQ